MDTNQKTKKRREDWVILTSMFAEISGLFHDFGKITKFFQDKLRKAKDPKSKPEDMVDPVRHEWISAAVFLKCVKEWEKENFTNFSMNEEWLKKRFLSVFNDLSISSIDTFFWDQPNWQAKTKNEIIFWNILSHHKLMGSEDNNFGNLNNSAHIREHIQNIMGFPGVDEKYLNPVSPLMNALQRAWIIWKKIQSHTIVINQENASFFILKSRSALILADHKVSGIRNLPKNKDLPVANLNGDKKDLNQELGWHILQVGSSARRMVFRMESFQIPQIENKEVEEILKNVVDQKFKWQDQLRDVLEIGTQYLILNSSGTGRGKTLANIKAATKLSKNFSYSLNLRSLTMQTAAEVSNHLNDSQYSTVIGCQASKKIFEMEKGKNLEDEDGNDPQLQWTSFSKNQNIQSPFWMRDFLEKEKTLKDILFHSALISTIDYLEEAGNPTRQAHHAMALLRLKDSTLILDEIDSYSPEGINSLCSLIKNAVMMGSNIIASSATLPSPIAKKIHMAFQSGLQARQSATGQTVKNKTIYVDGERIVQVDNINELEFCKESDGRLSKLVDVKSTRNDYISRILQSIQELHTCFKEKNEINIKEESFGFLRFANVKPLQEIGKEIIKTWQMKEKCYFDRTRVFFIPYHSRTLPIFRRETESFLDCILKRKNSKPYEHPLLDEYRKKALNDPNCDDVCFVIMASPVEEVGRDHDFDWGIFEPSGLHSLIQGAGRILRHRSNLLAEQKSPRIHILNQNLKAISGEKVVFEKPGIEDKNNFYKKDDGSSSSFVSDLLNKDLETPFILGKMNRYMETPMANSENAILEKKTKDSNAIIDSSSGSYSRNWYKKNRIRSFDGIRKDNWRFHWEKQSLSIQMMDTQYQWINKNVNQQIEIPNLNINREIFVFPNFKNLEEIVLNWESKGLEGFLINSMMEFEINEGKPAVISPEWGIQYL